jgi:hypothetical protein
VETMALLISTIYKGKVWLLPMTYSTMMENVTLAEIMTVSFLIFSVLLVEFRLIPSFSSCYLSIIVAAYYSLIYAGHGNIHGCGVCLGVIIGSVTTIRSISQIKSTSSGLNGAKSIHSNMPNKVKNSVQQQESFRYQHQQQQVEVKSPVRFRKLRKQSSKIIGVSGFFTPKSPESFKEGLRDEQEVNEQEEESKSIDDIMSTYSGQWVQMGPCVNFDKFLPMLGISWAMR